MGLSDASKFTKITKDNFASIFSNVKSNDVHGITLHWSVGLHTQLWDEYQFNIDGDGNIWMNNAGWDESGQHLSLDHIGHGTASADPLSQLWHRNTGNVGIAWDAMYGATEPSVSYQQPSLYSFPSEYGTQAPTQAQVDSMAWLTAMLVRHYGLSFDAVKSHYEWAVIDNYADERWDLRFEMGNIMEQVRDIYEATKPQ